MNFRLKSLIVWPKNTENEIRIISFELDKVSVITGGSEKGKSAIIAIIDYCLGSSSCRIPTKIIRDKSAFFGVLIELDNNSQLLLARKEPGDEQVSNEMFLKEGSNIILPEIMVSNCHTNDVKNRLNNIAKLLPNNFIRVHRSYLIPMSKVAQWSSREIILGEHKIPIGKTYHKEVQELLKKNIL